jgi:hypothetical protein
MVGIVRRQRPDGVQVFGNTTMASIANGCRSCTWRTASRSSSMWSVKSAEVRPARFTVKK